MSVARHCPLLCSDKACRTYFFNLPHNLQIFCNFWMIFYQPISALSDFITNSGFSANYKAEWHCHPKEILNHHFLILPNWPFLNFANHSQYVQFSSLDNSSNNLCFACCLTQLEREYAVPQYGSHPLFFFFSTQDKWTMKTEHAKSDLNCIDSVLFWKKRAQGTFIQIYLYCLQYDLHFNNVVNNKIFYILFYIYYHIIININYFTFRNRISLWIKRQTLPVRIQNGVLMLIAKMLVKTYISINYYLLM